MSDDETIPAPSPADSAWFATTHWSVVASARDPDGPQAQAALEQLCRTYWYPLYVFVRRQGRSVADGEDLVQGFFAKFIEKNYLAGVEREKGRFRSFLLMAFKRYAANEWDRDRREKRGGGRGVVSLDGPDTELRYSIEATQAASPEQAYERQWALTLLDQVLNRLEAELDLPGKRNIFGALKMFLNGEKGASYAEVGAKLGMSEGAVKVAVHRLRQRYRDLLRLEIANTVGDPGSVEDEMRHLLAALA